jgi:hypothetical protein
MIQRIDRNEKWPEDRQIHQLETRIVAEAKTLAKMKVHRERHRERMDRIRSLRSSVECRILEVTEKIRCGRMLRSSLPDRGLPADPK